MKHATQKRHANDSGNRRLAGPQGDQFHTRAVAEYEQIAQLDRSIARP